MTRTYDYDDPRWRSERFTCVDCGWIGSAGETAQRVHRGRLDLVCGGCDRVLAHVSHASAGSRRTPVQHDETRHAPEPSGPPGAGDADGDERTRILAAFSRQLEHWGIEPPPHSLTSSRSGVIRRQGWFIRFVWGSDAAGGFLDFYASHLMGDRHHRIRHDGRVEERDALRRWLEVPAEATEAQIRSLRDEFAAHNARVLEELERKFGRTRRR